MFVLLAGPRSTERDGLLEQMAARLLGAAGTPRVWRDPARNGGAASLAPDFVPEDRFDVQPLVSRERLFVCQARIDNRDELMANLELPAGVAIADSTLLAAAYDRWGEECVQRIAGDFAFAAWHRRDGHVFAAVDPLGARRLLWARSAAGIVLSAQLPAMLAHPEVSSEPDLDGIARLFRSGIDRTSSVFAAVRSLPGGERLTWRAGDMRIARWWNPVTRPTVWYRDGRDYVAETRELFTRAVSAQLRSSTAISSTLSGGLDSGSVTATAARLLSSSGATLTAYTSVPQPGLQPSERPGWEADDREYASEVAARYETIEHRLIDPGGRCALDTIASLHSRSRTPSKPTTNLLWIDGICSAAAEAGSRVMLTGERGNAAFSWRGEGTLFELARVGRLRAALAQGVDEARARDTSLVRVLAGSVRAALRTALRPAAGDEIVSPGLQFIRQRRQVLVSDNEYRFPLGSRQFWAAFVMTPKHAWLPDPVLQWSIELRDPTADRRLLERLLQYPQAAFRVGGRDRALAREVAAGVLPDRVRLRRTQGAQAPEAPSLIAFHASRYQEALATMRGSASCRELFDLDVLQQTLDGFAGGLRDYYMALAFDRAIDAGLFLSGLERTR